MNVQYKLSANSANTTVVVSDSTGNVVYSANGETTAGNHMFTWNGQTAGVQLRAHRRTIEDQGDGASVGPAASAATSAALSRPSGPGRLRTRSTARPR